jgi:hypothetical protein
MLGLGFGTYIKIISGLNPSGYDPDAQAFFDRVTTAGGTLTTTEQNATNQLVLDMKSCGYLDSNESHLSNGRGKCGGVCAELKEFKFYGYIYKRLDFCEYGGNV